MCAMVVDFGDDPQAVAAEHQFTFGPAFLVAPVVELRARCHREVYLPGGVWYDFWSGRRWEGAVRSRQKAAAGHAAPLRARR